MQPDSSGKTETQVIKWRSPRLVLLLFFGLSLVSVAAAGIVLAMAGASSRRVLILVGITAVAGLIFLFLTILAGANRSWAERLWLGLFGNPRTARTLPLAFGVLDALSLLALLIPPTRFEKFANYHSVLFPLLASGTVIVTAAFLIALVQVLGIRKEALASLYQSQKRTLTMAAVLLALALVGWLVLALANIGVHANEDYWFGAGSPLLFQQALACIVFAIALFLYEDRIVAWVEKITRKKISPDLVIFLLVWLVAAILWAIPPAPSSFVAPHSLSPNNELYPFADALRYDLGSQFALIGQGFNNGRFYYRVFYEGFLFILHGLAGQNYENVMRAQAVLFAVFPAMVYMLGKTLKNRTLGILSASMVVFAGLNSLPASELVDLANPKQMLTDFPTALGVAGFTLLLILWLRKPERTSLLFWAAGILGATALVRTSALGLFPVLLVLVWFFLPQSWKTKLVLSALALVVFMASAIPWSTWQGRLVTDMYSLKILSVIGLRYDVLPMPDTVVKPPPRPHSSPVVAIASHFAHNLVTSVLILPPSPVFNDADSVVKGEFPYWDPQWDGRLNPVFGIFIVINLAVLALGVASAFQFSGWLGMFPLMIYFVYIGINSIGRTSGGRYSVPMDWIILFYFAWGVLAILGWLKTAFLSAPGTQAEIPARADPPQAVTLKSASLQAYPAFLILFGVSALMILLSFMVPKRYSLQPTDQLLADFLSKGYGQKAGMDASALQTFMKEDQAGIWTGRALFPRYYLAGLGIDAKQSAFQIQDYPRLVFSLVGPQDHIFVMLPGAMPKYFPDAVDSIVLGCKTADDIIEALIVVVTSDKPYVYSVPSSVALHCPLELKSSESGAPP